MDLIGAILAGGEVSDKPGMPQLMAALTENVQNFDPATIDAIQEALLTGQDFGKKGPTIDPNLGETMFNKVQAIEDANANNEGSVTMVGGEAAGGTGGGQDPTGQRSQAWQDFYGENDLGSGKYYFDEKNGQKVVYNSQGQQVAVFNAQTGKYE